MTIGTKLITNTKKQKIKNLEQSLEFQKYNVKEKKKKKKKQGQKMIKYTYEVCFKKNRVFFFLQSNRL